MEGSSEYEHPAFTFIVSVELGRAPVIFPQLIPGWSISPITQVEMRGIRTTTNTESKLRKATKKDLYG